MTQSTCIKCGNTSFEIQEATPRDSSFVLNFVQCANCGGVIGVLEFDNIGQLIYGLAEKLNIRLR